MIRYRKSLYVHIPKTAGMWVEDLMCRHGGHRFSYSHDIPKNHTIQIALRGLRPFTLVRHPLLFVHSVWRHWSGNAQCRISCQSVSKRYMWDKELCADFYCDSVVEGDFEQTLINFTRNWPGFVSWLYGQFTFGCWYVGKYEQLQDDLIRGLSLCSGGRGMQTLPKDLINSIISTPPLNTSKGRHGKAAKNIIDEFMASEPVINEYNYGYVPARLVR